MLYNSEHYVDLTAELAIHRADRQHEFREEIRGMTKKEFYKSRAWRRTRDAYIEKRISIDGGLCEVCRQDLGYIVHHVQWLTDETAGDPSISLNEANLRYECLNCHNREKDPKTRVPGQVLYAYGPDGEVRLTKK